MIVEVTDCRSNKGSHFSNDIFAQRTKEDPLHKEREGPAATDLAAASTQGLKI